MAKGNFQIKGQKPMRRSVDIGAFKPRKSVFEEAAGQLRRLGGAVRARVKSQKTSENLKKGFY